MTTDKPTLTLEDIQSFEDGITNFVKAGMMPAKYTEFAKQFCHYARIGLLNEDDDAPQENEHISYNGD